MEGALETCQVPPRPRWISCGLQPGLGSREVNSTLAFPGASSKGAGPKSPWPRSHPCERPGKQGARLWGCFSHSCLCPTCTVGAGTSVGLWAAEGEAWVRRGRRGNGFQVRVAAQAGLEPLEVWELLKLSCDHYPRIGGWGL